MSSNDTSKANRSIPDYLLDEYRAALQAYFHQDKILQERTRLFLAVNTGLIAIANFGGGSSPVAVSDPGRSNDIMELGAVTLFGALTAIAWFFTYHRGGRYISQVKMHLRYLEGMSDELSLFTKQEKLFYSKDKSIEYENTYKGHLKIGPLGNFSQQRIEHALPLLVLLMWIGLAWLL